jgi:hypothetical protein
MSNIAQLSNWKWALVSEETVLTFVGLFTIALPSIVFAVGRLPARVQLLRDPNGQRRN